MNVDAIEIVNLWLNGFTWINLLIYLLIIY